MHLVTRSVADARRCGVRSDALLQSKKPSLLHLIKEFALWPSNLEVVAQLVVQVQHDHLLRQISNFDVFERFIRNGIVAQQSPARTDLQSLLEALRHLSAHVRLRTNLLLRKSELARFEAWRVLAVDC